MKLRLPSILTAVLLAASFTCPTSWSATENIVSGTDPAPPLIIAESMTYILQGPVVYSLDTPLANPGIFYNLNDAPYDIVLKSAPGKQYDLSFVFNLDDGEYMNAVTSGERLPANHRAAGKIVFDQLGNVLFSGNASNIDGGAIYSFTIAGLNENLNSGVYFQEISGSIHFLNNRADRVLNKGYGSGGAIFAEAQSSYASLNDHAVSGLKFTSVSGSVLFSGNQAEGRGGAINTSFSAGTNKNEAISVITAGTVFSDIGGNVLFENNSAGDHGGAIFSLAYSNSSSNSAVSQSTVNSETTFSSIGGNLGFQGNKTQGNGGALAMQADAMGLTEEVFTTTHLNTTFSDIAGKISFAGNIAAADGGAIAVWSATRTSNVSLVNASVIFRNISNDISFTDNASGGDGGAISLKPKSLSEVSSATNCSLEFHDITGNILFSGNRAGGNGGALLGYSSLYTAIADVEHTMNMEFRDITGNINFAGNEAGGYGGAIAILKDTKNHTLNSHLSISGIKGDVLFERNHSGKEGGAIYMDAGVLTLSADGGNITFAGNLHDEDGMIANSVWIDGDGTLSELRAREGYTVAFYDCVVSLWNLSVLDLNKSGADKEYAGTILFSGEHVETYILREPDESDAEYERRISLSRESDIYQDAILHNGTLHAADKAELNLTSLTVNNAEIKTTRDGLIKSQNDIHLNNGKLDVKGIILGNGPVALHVKENLSGTIHLWDKSGDLYTASGLLNTGKSIALLTLATDETDYSGLSLDPVSEAPAYGNQGFWTLEWDTEAAAPDGPAHTLFAVWTKTGYIVDPQKVGEMTLNSLWSSKSNLASFSTTTLNQLGLARHSSVKDSNIWATGLGDFGMQRSSNTVDGYDYWGGGYALGTDTRLNKNLIAGVAFSQITGTSQSRNYSANIDQDSLMWEVYGSYLQKLDDWNALRYELTAGYGITSNKMASYFTDGGFAYGKWDNKTWNINFRVNWDTLLGNGWMLTPFIGLDYSTGEQEAFTESGGSARHFQKASLDNLSLPVGAGIRKVFPLSNGMLWDNSFSLSYVPDIYRDNAASGVNFVGDSNVWNARAINSPRNSGRMNLYSKLHLTDSWAAFAGYQLDARDGGTSQQVNLGASYTF